MYMGTWCVGTARPQSRFLFRALSMRSSWLCLELVVGAQTWLVAMQPPLLSFGGCSRLLRGLTTASLLWDTLTMHQRACMDICTLFGGLFPTVDSNTFPLPWQLIAPKKKWSNVLYSML